MVNYSSQRKFTAKKLKIHDIVLKNCLLIYSKIKTNSRYGNIIDIEIEVNSLLNKFSGKSTITNCDD